MRTETGQKVIAAAVAILERKESTPEAISWARFIFNANCTARRVDE